MKATKIASALITILTLISITACSNSQENKTVLPTDTTVETPDVQVVEAADYSEEYNIEMPEPFGEGGYDNPLYYQHCNSVFESVSGGLMDAIPQNEVDEWVQKHFASKEIPTSIKDYINIYSFITDFNITREEAEKALSDYLSADEGQTGLSHDHLDIIFSDNVELITETFASEYSIVISEKIYSPEWIYTHSIDDYRTEGITAEMISEKLDLYSDIAFTEDARVAFSKKLSVFTGKSINIEAANTIDNYDENSTASDEIIVDGEEDNAVYAEVEES